MTAEISNTQQNKITKKNILLVGDGGVGKSCLVDRLSQHIFESRYLPNFAINTTEINTTENNNYNIYDFPGQELHCLIHHKPYIQDTNLCIIMYDLTSKLSYQNVLIWKKQITELIGKMPFIIVGNKKDIYHRKVRDKTLEISSKRNTNIDKLLLKINDKLKSEK
tara:strand:- start:1353 stop:1847 length:495 start_codon:yes stop_codon:yes gene_type:complete